MENGNYDKIYYGLFVYLFSINLIAPKDHRGSGEGYNPPDGDYILATPLGTGSNHSPLLGYAYDGNPIYGGRLYANGVDASEGLKKAYSGYVLVESRSNSVPSGGDETATMPPSELVYPLGSFVEDYVYDPKAVTQKNRIMTEDYERILTETGDFILASRPVPLDWILNKNNAVKCNTPEYPKEFYPDGVWIYVATEVASEPTFPYIIGQTFEDRPVSQNVTGVSTREPEVGNFVIYNPRSIYTDSRSNSTLTM